MSGSYRLLGIAACVLALFAALGTGAFYGSLYAPQHKNYRAERGTEPAGEDYQGPSQSLPDIAGVPGPIERLIANPRPTSGKDNEQRDLAAQEASALWAFWMVVATACSVLITVVGTVLLYRQIVLTREAVQETTKATKAMERQNDIAEHAQRSWIALSEFKFSEERGKFVDGKMLAVVENCQIALRNVGGGLGKITTRYIEYRILAADSEVPVFEPGNIEGAAMVIGPTFEFFIGTAIPGPIGSAGPIDLWVYVYVGYCDMLSKKECWTEVTLKKEVRFIQDNARAFKQVHTYIAGPQNDMT